MNIITVIGFIILGLFASADEKRAYFHINVGTDDEFESIEFHEVRRFAIQSKMKLKQAGRVYKTNQFDCEDFVRALINEIKVYHDYQYTPMVYQVNIAYKGGIHAVLGYQNISGKEFLYDSQSYKAMDGYKVLERIF